MAKESGAAVFPSVPSEAELAWRPVDREALSRNLIHSIAGDRGDQKRIQFLNRLFLKILNRIFGGRGEIRTHERLAPLPVFKTGALNHSATLP